MHICNSLLARPVPFESKQTLFLVFPASDPNKYSLLHLNQFLNIPVSAYILKVYYNCCIPGTLYGFTARHNVINLPSWTLMFWLIILRPKWWAKLPRHTVGRQPSEPCVHSDSQPQPPTKTEGSAPFLAAAMVESFTKLQALIAVPLAALLT